MPVGAAGAGVGNTIGGVLGTTLAGGGDSAGAAGIEGLPVLGLGEAVVFELTGAGDD
jgi:hypothetical protein